MVHPLYRLESATLASAVGENVPQPQLEVISGAERGAARGAVRSWRARSGAWRAGYLRIVACALVATAAACTTTPNIDKDTSAEQKQKIVAERAEARWQALIAKDLDTAYGYLSPGSKAATTLEQYKKQIKPGIWRQAKASDVTCEGEICKVTIDITYDTNRMKGIETQLPENWIIENGNAWYVYR